MNTDSVKDIVRKNATLTTLKPYLRKYIYLEYEYKKIVPRGLKMLMSQKRYKEKRVIDAIGKLLSEVEIKIDSNSELVYFLDENKTIGSAASIIGNMTIDYSKFIENGLSDFVGGVNVDSSQIVAEQSKLLEAIKVFINRIIDELKKDHGSNVKKKICCFENMLDKRAESFYDALQRVLFLNQLLWQTGHRLNGLGRMDYYLADYFEQDINSGKLSKKRTKAYITEVYRLLHNDYWFKSDSLPGDTGQIIILGGLNADGTYFSTQLTEIFLEVQKEFASPDPKILLRVSKKMPNYLLEQAVDCLLAQTGSPLFANDDVIIPCLIASGIEDSDAYAYVTSACWEPFIVGKSFDQNNIDSMNLMEPFCAMILNEDLTKYSSFDDVFEKYKNYLREYIKKFIHNLSSITWERDPIFTLFTENSQKNEDIVCHGAKYFHYGVTTAGIPNLVNNLLLLKNAVFYEGKYSLSELESGRKNDWKELGNLQNRLREDANYFGKDNDDVISTVNEITSLIVEYLKRYNKLLPEIKFGLSSPAYVMRAKSLPATYDGRNNGDPLIPHISKAGAAFTEIVNFAAKLDYSDNRHNGNVVDFFIVPSDIMGNRDKFINFFKIAFHSGIFEMQMNVQDSKTLIAAKQEPHKYPNLIVRVWGFSAYFRDLPVSYQDILIERAVSDERR